MCLVFLQRSRTGAEVLFNRNSSKLKLWKTLVLCELKIWGNFIYPVRDPFNRFKMDFEMTNSLSGAEEMIEGLLDIVKNTVSGVEEDLRDDQKALEIKEGRISGEKQRLEESLKLKQRQRNSLKEELENREKAMNLQPSRVGLIEKDINVHRDDDASNSIQYHKELIEYAQNKIKLFYNISKVKWDLNPHRVRGTICGESFDLPEEGPFSTVNQMWSLLEEHLTN